MKTTRRWMSVLLTLALLLSCMTGLAYADETPGKYVQDVFIAYGRTENEARTWLTNNGWEPLAGNADFCAGKDSFWDKSIAAVMGIKRTDDPEDAVTDMAVMNMTGGYSFPDYEKLLEKKKAEIDEFIYGYMPIIEEYRQNYNSKTVTPGKKRAELAYELLNKFYDGGADEPYAQNDTGKKLGSLLLAETRQEGNMAGGDLQQIFMESSGIVLILIEQMLALAADTGEDTWLERLAGLSGSNLIKNIEKYIPDVKGQNLAASAVNTLLRERFGDSARTLADQWEDIHEELAWYEEYCNEYDLWGVEGESADDYTKRVDASFAQRKQDNAALPKDQQIEEVRIDADRERFDSAIVLCENLYVTPYKGEWGETLADFFNPYNGKNYGADDDNFLPFAVAMSPGQRAALEMIALRTMLLIGFADAAALDQAGPDLDEVFKADPETGKTPLELSVYTGVNRGIFRGGVALTSRADMDQHSGHGNAYDEIYDHLGMLSLASYATAAVGAVTFIAGTIGAVKGGVWVKGATKAEKAAMRARIKEANNLAGRGTDPNVTVTEFQKAVDDAQKLPAKLEKMENDKSWHLKKMGTAGKVFMCIGAALMIAAAFAKGYQLYKYYQRTFTPIPLMIVDESDIVTYSKDAEGNDIQSINFDQYEYYQAVNCNRQAMGEISDWQSGVSDYKKWGCGDVADLNGDFGQEWLALYTVKSPRKGNPILADSLVLQYGSNEMPKGCDGSLHKFTYTNAQDLGDTAYSFNNKKNGVYFFWNSDPKAYDTPKTASAFSGGQLALAGAAGLIIGVLGATLALYPKRKREDPLASD